MLRYLTSGESHGKSLISILDGIPANIELNIDEINYELEKRQGGSTAWAAFIRLPMTSAPS